MYFQSATIRNLGPLNDVHIEAAFDDGRPRPLIVVGANGGGKTHFLSLVADAIFEGQAKHYRDVLPASVGGGRSWFRIVGGATRRIGAPFATAVLTFVEGEKTHFFVERSGTVPQEVVEDYPNEVQSAIRSTAKEHVKEIDISDAVSKRIFATGTYTFFPSSRSETPHWLNTNAIREEALDDNRRFGTDLKKPLFVERGIEKLAEWIAAVMVDSRTDFALQVIDNELRAVPTAVTQSMIQARAIYENLNRILACILDDKSARFVWLGRYASSRVGITCDSVGPLLSLRALSAGQATLLSIFGNVLRYAEMGGATSSSAAEGICVIDEIDAHIHLDLQHRALPQLLGMFRKVQFIISCHSPFFILGLQASALRATILDIGQGIPVEAESYSEFSKAIEVIRGTSAFSKALTESTSSKSERLLVLTEGETDPQYLLAAASLRGHEALLADVDFEWIGAKEVGGAAFNTGKDALNHAYSLLRAKPLLVQRPVLLLYDVDTNKPSIDEGSLHVRCIPISAENNILTAGIENLLPSAVFSDDMFTERTTRKPNGTTTIVRELHKVKLAEYLCAQERNPEHFRNFDAVLEVIKSLIDHHKSSTTPVDWTDLSPSLQPVVKSPP